MSIYKLRGPYYPQWRVEAGRGTGVYSDRSYDAYQGIESQVDQASINTASGRIGLAFSGFETELAHTLTGTTSTLDWTERRDFALRENYYWPNFQWVQPGIGYFEVWQTKAERDEAADPVAFVRRNTGMIFGLSTRFAPSFWKSHGPVFSGRMDYRASLEATRNFGNAQILGVGYGIAGKNLRFMFEGRITRDYFNASRELKDEVTREIGVRHVSIVRELWASVHYWPTRKR